MHPTLGGTPVIVVEGVARDVVHAASHRARTSASSVAESADVGNDTTCTLRVYGERRAKEKAMATVSVRYIVDDVDAAIAFYCEQLGFRR